MRKKLIIAIILIQIASIIVLSVFPNLSRVEAGIISKYTQSSDKTSITLEFKTDASDNVTVVTYYYNTNNGNYELSSEVWESVQYYFGNWHENEEGLSDGIPQVIDADTLEGIKGYGSINSDAEMPHVSSSMENSINNTQNLINEKPQNSVKDSTATQTNQVQDNSSTIQSQSSAFANLKEGYNIVNGKLYFTYKSDEELVSVEYYQDANGNYIASDSTRVYSNGERKNTTPGDPYLIALSGDTYYPNISPEEFSQITGLEMTESMQQVTETIEEANEQNEENGIGVDDIVDGIAGVLLYPIRLLLVIVGGAIGIVLNLFAGGAENATLSIEDILFNRVDITNIDFFSTTSAGTEIDKIRDNVAMWYVGIRNLAAVMLILILIYVAIRMAISTIAEDKAKYKTMLVDWLTSLCLLFVLHFIMEITIKLNNTLVTTIENAMTESNGTWDEGQMIENALLSIKFSEGMGYAFVYLMLEAMTLLFLLSYIKRMITIAFLMVIAPLVTVTYAIDKMGDGKSQALNEWLKEFIYNILIQPFQCITYVALCSVAFGLLDNGTLQSTVLAILFLVFLWQAEKIIKHIFNFRAGSLSDTVAQAAVTTAVLTGVGKIGKAASGGGGSSKNPKIPQQKDKSQSSGKSTPTQSDSNAPANDGVPDAGNQNGNASGGIGTASAKGGQAAQKSGTSRGMKIAKGAENFGKAVLRANLKLGGAFMGAALGAGTGSLDTTVLGATAMAGITSNMAKNATVAHRKHEVARAFNDYKQASGITDDEQIAKTGMEFLDGTRQATTEEEIAYRDSLIKMQNMYRKNGDSESDSYKHTKAVANGVADGSIGEGVSAVRFYGKVKEKNNRTRISHQEPKDNLEEQEKDAQKKNKEKEELWKNPIANPDYDPNRHIIL